MSSKAMGTTCRLVAELLQIRQPYISCIKRKYITFKEKAIEILEETLKNNVGLKETSSDIFKSMINNNAVTNLISEQFEKPMIDLKTEIERRQALFALTDFLYKQPMYTLIHTVNNIDTECCNLLNVMSYYDIFKLLLFFTKSVPAKINRMNFYNEVMHLLREGISNQVFSKDEIILCIYFFGLTKIHGANDVRIALGNLKFNELSLHEICIVAETAYKCGVKLLQPQRNYLEKVLESEAEILMANTNLLVPLCKILRFTGLTTDFLPNNLNKEIVNKSKPLRIIPAIYILKLYKEIYFAEPTVLKRLVTDVMASISLANQTFNDKCGLYRSQIYEPKYIDRFLWCICMLNYKLTEMQLLEIRTFLDNMELNLFLKPQKLLRIILSLWILGYRSENMIQKCIERNVFLQVSNSKHWGYKISTNLLLHVIKIESQNIKLHNNLFPNVYIKLNIPKSLQVLSEIVGGLSQKMQFQNVIINSPIGGIYIAGISFDHPTLGNFHIDLLNDITCLRHQKIPHGLMNLKLRLLEQLGYQSILVDEDIVKDKVVAVEYIEKLLYEIIHSNAK